MARPIWKGSISFGLVNIPVTLYVAENASSGVHFHLLDSRNNARIHYVRVNDNTQKEVPWDKIVKAYEYKKGKYVVMNEKDLEKITAEQFQTVSLQDFVDEQAIPAIYFEKPYYLVPNKQGEKGYVLLRETLRKTKKIGIAQVVIRTRQYLAALYPYRNILILNLLRYYGDLRSVEELEFAIKELKDYKVSTQELEMATQLVTTMSRSWDPKKYHDESREVMQKIVQGKIKHEKSVKTPEVLPILKPEGKVIDFMSLLKRSIREKGKHRSSRKSPTTRRGGHKTHSHRMPSKPKRKGSRGA